MPQLMHHVCANDRLQPLEVAHENERGLISAQHQGGVCHARVELKVVHVELNGERNVGVRQRKILSQLLQITGDLSEQQRLLHRATAFLQDVVINSESHNGQHRERTT